MVLLRLQKGTQSPASNGLPSFLGLCPCPPSSKPTRVHLFLISARKIFFLKDSCDEIGSSWVIQDSLTSQGPSQGPRSNACVQSPLLHMVTYSQFPRIRPWTSLRGHYSACHIHKQVLGKMENGKSRYYLTM